MTHRAHRDHLYEGWTQAGLTDPPPWGESLPDEWMHVELNFYRRQSTTENTIGGFKGSGVPVTFWIVNGKAELRTDSGFSNTVESGPFVRRVYDMFVPIPDDYAGPTDARLPKKGDRVWWYDALGRRIDVGLASVDVPEGIADHIEIESEEFE